jgi:hypothetical protein
MSGNGHERRAASLLTRQRPRGIDPCSGELGTHELSVTPRHAGWQLAAAMDAVRNFGRRRWPTAPGRRTLAT